MSASSFPCPHCSTALRIKDRKLIGRRVACPDCGEQIEIVADGPRGLAARTLPANPASPAAAPQVRTTRRVSPAHLGWLAAGAAALTILFVANPFGSGSIIQPVTSDISEVEPPQPAAPPDIPAEPDKAIVLDTAESRLTELGRQLAGYAEEHGHFPAGTVAAGETAVADRFSWLAQLAARSGPAGIRPWWDHKWRDPVNDRFVRRSLPEFQNPAIEQKTGQNRYPATHFVGVAGVGDDAAELPIDHPRAGIFGHDRRTMIDHIRDGTANTLAVAGVTSELGSWAAAGRGTVRPFNRRPYINGPDGFGTGQDDGMFVLMADGSVRFLSNETDPLNIQRMAAMADGLPLDPSVPGEPGTPPAEIAGPNTPDHVPGVPIPEPANAADNAHAAPVAAEPPVTAPKPEPVIDVAGKLNQKIRRFDQPLVTLADLLLVLEEMAGVPIRYDAEALNETALTRSVSLTAEETTVGGILERLLEQHRLTYEIERDGIRLIRAESPDDE